MESYSRFRFKIYRRRLWRWLRKNTAALIAVSKKYIFRRTDNLREVQRFVLGWLGIAAVIAIALSVQISNLKPLYLTAGPRSGGSVSEGVIGTFPSLNPLFPQNNATAAANRLIFSGLVQNDSSGKIAADLAEGWQTDESGRVYTFHLRKDIKWHDGEPLTAKDVVYTFTTAANSNTTSPLADNWRGITVSAPDEQTVVFNLPVAYTPFLESLTTGILPAHILANTEPAQLRKVDFNQHPVGTGPFAFHDFSFNHDEVRLEANPDYYGGKPLLESFTLKAYADKGALEQAYITGQVTMAGGLSSSDVADIRTIDGTKVLELPIAEQGFVFFNTERPALQNKQLRQGITQATDTADIAQQLRNGFQPGFGPLMPQQLGYSPAQTQLGFNPAQAAASLDAAGWKVGPDGQRQQNNEPLHFEIVTQKDDVYPAVAASLKTQWAKLGIQLEIKLVSLEELQQNYLRQRNYDLLLSGIAQGADPDVYAYWHSTQVNDPGLNLSKYKSTTADQALEAGRTRIDPKLRAAKYEAFQAAWRDDAPAISIFRPVYFYSMRMANLGITNRFLSGPVDRFYNVQQWSINTQPVLKRTAKE